MQHRKLLGKAPEAPRRSVVEIRSTAILKQDTLKNRCTEFHLIFASGSEKARFVLFSHYYTMYGEREEGLGLLSTMSGLLISSSGVVFT